MCQILVMEPHLCRLIVGGSFRPAWQGYFGEGASQRKLHICSFYPYFSTM